MINRFDLRSNAQEQIHDWIMEVVEDNRARNEAGIELLDTKTKAIAIDAEVASGKSYSLAKAVNENNLSAIVFVEQIDTCNQLAEVMNGIAVHSEAVEAGEAVRDMLDRVIKQHTVVIMTHSSLRTLLDGEDYQYVFSHFDLIAVDETFKSHDTLSNDIDTIRNILTPLNLLDTEEASEMSGYIKMLHKSAINDHDGVVLIDASNLSKAMLTRLITQIEELGEVKNPVSNDLLKPALNFLYHLLYHEDKVLYLEKSGSKSHFVAVRNFFPKHRSLIILADGCSKDGSLIALQKYHHNSVDVQIHTLPRGSWSNYKVVYEYGNTGKGSTSNITDKQLSKAVEILKTKPTGLVICHKGLEDRLIKEDLEHRVIHWGVHRSRNDLSDYDHIYILSLFHKPSYANSSGYISAIDKDRYKSGEYEQHDIPTKSLFIELKQAIGRSNRSLQDDMKVDVCVILPKGSTGENILDMLRRDMPEAEFTEETWYGVGNTSAREKAQEWASDIMDGFYTQNTLGKAVTLSSCVSDNHALNGLRRYPAIWNRIQQIVADTGLSIRKWDGSESVINAKRLDPGKTYVIS